MLLHSHFQTASEQIISNCDIGAVCGNGLFLATLLICAVVATVYVTIRRWRLNE